MGFEISSINHYCIVTTGNMKAQDASMLMHLNKKELSEHEMNYEATVALINYFSELAKGKSHSSIDYVFMEQILLSAGEMGFLFLNF